MDKQLEAARALVTGAKPPTNCATLMSSTVSRLAGMLMVSLRVLLGVEAALEPLQTAIKSGSATSGIAPVVVAPSGQEARHPNGLVRCGAGCVEMFCGLLLALMIGLIGLGVSYAYGLTIWRVGKDLACHSVVAIESGTVDLRAELAKGYCTNVQSQGGFFSQEEYEKCTAAIDDFCDESGGCPDHYELLGVPKTATMKEIKTAYKKASRIWHPDKCPQRGECADGLDPDTCSDGCTHGCTDEVCHQRTMCLTEAGGRGGTLPDEAKRELLPV